MIRLAKTLLPLLAFLAWPAAGCGSSNGEEQKTLADYLPTDGEVTGWQEDVNRGEPGPEVTHDADEATLWVNGAMDMFVESGGWAGLGQEFYINGSLRIKLELHEWSDAAAAAQGYQDLVDYHEFDVPGWTDLQLGAGEAACRTARVSTFYWYVNAHKGKYLVDLTCEPASDDAAETAAQDFTKAVLNKLP